MKKVYERPITEIIGCKIESLLGDPNSGIIGGDGWEANRAIFEEENEDGDNNQGNTTDDVNFTLWD